MRKNKKNNREFTVAEAVEKLFSIAEMDFDRETLLFTGKEVPIIPEPDEISEINLRKEVHWLHAQGSEETQELIKEFFRTIHGYLKHYYEKECHYQINEKATEGIKAIMVIVGEAAKKIDQRRDVFIGTKITSVTQFPEFKRLQEFYLSKIARKFDDKLLSKWILALSQRLITQARQHKASKPLLSTQHLFVDLDSVKKDMEYELLLIRKEDGSRYYSPKLIRNIKLVCDFSTRLEQQKEDDAWESVSNWRDQLSCEAARTILRVISPQIGRFYREVGQLREEELPSCLSKALMALMMSSNLHNISHDPSVKSSSTYLMDFQGFLRQALQTREYQRLLAYPSKEPAARILFDLTNALCEALFIDLPGYQKIYPLFHKWVSTKKESSKQNVAKKESCQLLLSRLRQEYVILSSLLKHHANGPLVKILELLEEGNDHFFDPLLQENFPCRNFIMEYNHHKITSIRMPCPVHQEFIHKASVVEEWKSFLRILSKEKFLLINLQDRTSWSEHTRCVAIEELQKHSDFENHLVVVSLPKDSDFYYQEPPYDADHHSKVFMRHFREHLLDESCGFYFPDKLRKNFSSKMIDHLLNGVHQFFFKGRNVLTKEKRLNFIEIVYLLLELRLIGLIQPSYFSLCCKDGIDIGPTANVPLYVLLRWLAGEDLTPTDMEVIALVLHAPAITIRERIVNLQRFERMTNLLKSIEEVREELGNQAFAEGITKQFIAFFNGELLEIKIAEELVLQATSH